MQKLQLMSQLRCQKHINSCISFVQVSQQCPYQSRLACGKCMIEYKCVDNFIDINDFLSTETLLSSIKSIKGDKQVVLLYLRESQQEYKQQQQLYQQQIDSCIQDMLTKINEFKATLMKQLDSHKEYLNQMMSLRIQYDAELVNLQNKVKQVSELEDYHKRIEWIELEECVQQCVSLIYEPENQEIQVTLNSLNTSMQTRFNQQTFIDFKASLDVPLNKLLQNQPSVKLTQTILDKTNFGNQLIDRITDNRKKQLKLIFNGQRDGMNAGAFWKHCLNMGPTIMICESKSGQVFGGYTPCKWINKNQWQQDESMTSFLFSVTKQQIYPLKNKANTIYCNNDYGPTFGGGDDLYIAPDFQSGHSILSNSYDYSQYQISDPKTHLFGGLTPALMSIEIYLIE